MKKYIYILFTLTISAFIFIPTISFAGDDATIELNPRNPNPYTSVTATLVSYTFDVNTSLIIWSINGKEFLRGIGEKKITLQTGAVGSPLPIHVTAVTADNSTFEIDMVITPESVDILYETPESYVPLFYEGKSLPGEGALTKFVAMPNISENGMVVPASSLSYSWFVNDSFVDNLSGRGKQSAMINLELLTSSTKIKVMVRGPRGTIAEKEIKIYPHEIMPLLYTHDEILGTNHTSLITRRFEATNDFTLALEPFYLSVNNSLQNTVLYSWLLDGLPVTPLGGTLLSMHPKEDTYGHRKLSISVENSKRRLQKATIDLDLIFDTRQ